MLTILVKSIVSANTNTNTAFEKYCQYQYFCDNTFTVYFIQQHSFFHRHLLINLVAEKMAK